MGNATYYNNWQEEMERKWRGNILVKNKLNIITGTPRSGTSCMTILVRSSIGDELLIGKAFPKDDRLSIEQRINLIENEEVRDYYLEKIKDMPVAPQDDAYKDLNKDGFWECRYSVQGITYHDDFPDLTGKYCKIVSGGVAKSNPDYINKIVLMARNPRQVAKSQERLKRKFEGQVHSPDMFIRNTFQIARWIEVHDKTNDILIVNYDNLISNPRGELDIVADFLERPRESFDETLVKSYFKRSNPENIEHHLWEVADKIFSLLLIKDWQGIINIFNESKTLVNREQTKTNCERLNKNMFYNQCVNCINNKRVRTANRHIAENKNIEWETKPCMFLCSTNQDKLVSLKSTIDNNHWQDVNPQEEKSGSLVDVIKTIGRTIVKGKLLVDRKVRLARFKTCSTCPIRKLGKCTACGCKIQNKVKFTGSKCPKGKWVE